MTNAQKPTCFVISPIGAKDSEIRKRSDKVLKHIFRKALSEKYEVIRGDEIDEPGMITSQVLRAVQESHLVVADLTGHNPNVLYELAVRHAIEKPVIHAIEPKLSKIPFDIAGFRTIEFDLTDPDSIESAVEQLQKRTQQAEKGKWGETPVKLANIMQRSSQDTENTVLLKEAVEGIAGLSRETVRQGYEMREEFAKINNTLMPAASLSSTMWGAAASGMASDEEAAEATDRARETLHGTPQPQPRGSLARAFSRNALRDRAMSPPPMSPPPEAPDKK